MSRILQVGQLVVAALCGYYGHMYYSKSGSLHEVGIVLVAAAGMIILGLIYGAINQDKTSRLENSLPDMDTGQAIRELEANAGWVKKMLAPTVERVKSLDPARVSQATHESLLEINQACSDLMDAMRGWDGTD